jgi:glutathione S-transferase
MSFHSEMPLKQMPVLEIDGKVKIAQLTAILRYLAHEFGKFCHSPPQYRISVRNSSTEFN